jgi:hypothetical protein
MTPLQSSAPHRNIHQHYQPPPPQKTTNSHPMNKVEQTNPTVPVHQYYEQRVKARNQRKAQYQPQPSGSSQGVSAMVNLVGQILRSVSHKQYFVFYFTQQSPRSPNHRYSHEQRSRYRPAHAPTATAAPPSTRPADSESSSQSGGAAAKSKLPHGLTVHELKEMTKARLQAENGSEASKGEQKRVSPLDFDAGFENRERATSRDSTSIRERAMSRDSTGALNHAKLHGMSDSMSSIPSMVQVNPSARDYPKGRQPQVSPLPPGFQHFGPGSSSMPSLSDGVDSSLRFPDANRSWQQHSRSDAWENASVTSHNSTVASEYLGSESAFSSGIPGPDDFGRPRAYTAGNSMPGPPDFPHDNAMSPANVSPGNPFFDAAVGGPNRRRACTLSPRPGLIHEDRPHFSGEPLGIPSFSDASASLLSRSRTNFSPVMPKGRADGPRFGHTNAGVIGGGFAEPPHRPRTVSDHVPGIFEGGFVDMSNRPRASSAASLPPMSHTSEEFFFDRSVPPSRFASSQGLMGNPPITEENPNSITDSIFGYASVSSGRDGPATGSNTTSVFRDVPSLHRQVAAPPGLFNSNDLAQSGQTPTTGFNPVFNRVGSMDSVTETRASSAWGSSAGDIFGSSAEFNAANVEDNLAQDLGSILKLSGVVGDRPERERANTYPHTSRQALGQYISEEFVGKDLGSFRY